MGGTGAREGIFVWDTHVRLGAAASVTARGMAVCLLCSQTISELKGRISELQWSVMNQELQAKGLESEKQELQAQLDLQRR